VFERIINAEAKASRTYESGNKCFLPPLREFPGGLFIESVRGSVIMSERAPNCPIYTECTITRVLQTFLAP
jgi:hypothetical protein